jgi:hypothetical protein
LNASLISDLKSHGFKASKVTSSHGLLFTVYIVETLVASRCDVKTYTVPGSQDEIKEHKRKEGDKTRVIYDVNKKEYTAPIHFNTI